MSSLCASHLGDLLVRDVEPQRLLGARQRDPVSRRQVRNLKFSRRYVILGACVARVERGRCSVLIIRHGAHLPERSLLIRRRSRCGRLQIHHPYIERDAVFLVEALPTPAASARRCPGWPCAWPALNVGRGSLSPTQVCRKCSHAPAAPGSRSGSGCRRCLRRLRFENAHLIAEVPADEGDHAADAGVKFGASGSSSGSSASSKLWPRARPRRWCRSGRRWSR